MATSSFIAAAAPTRVVRVSFTSLFDLAAHTYGNALQWVDIAKANKLTDPWVGAQTTIILPNIVSTATPTGVLTPTWPASSAASAGLFAIPSVNGVTSSSSASGLGNEPIGEFALGS